MLFFPMRKLILLIFIVFSSVSSFGAEHYSYKKRVLTAIKKRIPIFKRCYQHALDNHGHIRGKTINFIIKIAPEGYLGQIHVENSYHMGVLRCVNTNLAGLQFGPTPNGKQFAIKVPMNFKINYY